MDLTLEGIVTDGNDEHQANDVYDIADTLEGMVTDVKAVKLEKALLLMNLTQSPIMADVIADAGV